jgi:hypothetical protein
MTDYVVSLQDCSTTHPETGLIVRLRKNQLYPRNHPLVRARPQLFGKLPDIEQASAAPGEKRPTVRRGPQQ